MSKPDDIDNTAQQPDDGDPVATPELADTGASPVSPTEQQPPPLVYTIPRNARDLMRAVWGCDLQTKQRENATVFLGPVSQQLKADPLRIGLIITNTNGFTAATNFGWNSKLTFTQGICIDNQLIDPIVITWQDVGTLITEALFGITQSVGPDQYSLLEILLDVPR